MRSALAMLYPQHLGEATPQASVSFMNDSVAGDLRDGACWAQKRNDSPAGEAQEAAGEVGRGIRSEWVFASESQGCGGTWSTSLELGGCQAEIWLMFIHPPELVETQ